ncbi:MAG: helix-turn-helix transcriptional regulator [Ruminococcaceae bacterium]|nr:helix-turn-helix transcriptional regulator [Oscillospiraceae bacterium]
MPTIKLLKDPGFLYDLNFLFFLKFNTQLCVDNLEDNSKKESYEKYLKETLQYFGDISDDLYIFYHAIDNEHCFITTHYIDPYKNKFASDFNFKHFKKILGNTEQIIRNAVRFYLKDLPDEEIKECFMSQSKLFDCIKNSKYSGEEKSKLYEFFINPTVYIQVLQYELIQKEVLLSNYYKDNYEKILEAHNKITYETLCENLKGIRDLSFLQDGDQILYTSFCLLSKYRMKLFFIKEGAIYILGYDYPSIIDEVVNAKKMHPLEDLCDALSETSRMQILELLLEREDVTCKDLEKIFNFTGSTAYHHISLLTKIGAVKVRNEGKTIYYSLNRKYFDTMIERLKVFSNK